MNETTISADSGVTSEAERYRSEWLVGLTEGLVSALELFTTAASEEGPALRELHLRDVLAAQSSLDKVQIDKTLEAMAARCGNPKGEEMTVHWLMDHRAKGRLITWTVLVNPDHDQAPLDRFPWLEEEGEKT